MKLKVLFTGILSVAGLQYVSAQTDMKPEMSEIGRAHV